MTLAVIMPRSGAHHAHPAPCKKRTAPLSHNRSATESAFEGLGILSDCTHTHRCSGDQSLEAVESTRINVQLGGNTGLHQSHRIFDVFIAHQIELTDHHKRGW